MSDTRDQIPNVSGSPAPNQRQQQRQAPVVQPTPQPHAQRPSGSSSILVSPRQKGNPVVSCLKLQPWEYNSEIPADYVMGATTCALFLSLKYHRLHPEYIYNRIRNLQGKYRLRILLTFVDIPNHEDALRELSKTSVINNVTVVLCWSAAEAARYLELYKSYENAGFSAIQGQRNSGYADRLIEFVTVPRGINKADAVALVSNFGSLKNAINADAQQIGMIGGWGETKVKRWCSAVQEPFRAKNAAARRLEDVARIQPPPREVTETAAASYPVGEVPNKDERSGPADLGESTVHAQNVGETSSSAPPTSNQPPRLQESEEPPGQSGGLAPGIAAALARLRENG